jgi:putative sterol carrier protein
MRHTVPILADDLDSIPYVPGGTDTNSGVPRSEGRYLVPNEYMLNSMIGMFNPQAIPDLRATVQFTFSPPKGNDFDFGSANWYMNINDENCSLHEGHTALPTLSITTPYEVWFDIGMGTLNAESAFDGGKYDANGSITLLEQFPQIFQYPQPSENGKVNPELDMIMLGMPTAFNAKAGGDMDATIQFVLGGAGGGMYYQRIQNGECTAQRGPALSPDLTINAPAEVWLAISKGELDGQEAFMEAKYRATGDMNIMLKMGELFKATGLPPAPVSQSVIKEKEEKEEEMVDMTQLNCHDTIAGMPTVFNAEAAGDLSAKIQFVVSGEEPGTYHLLIVYVLKAFGQFLMETFSLVGWIIHLSFVGAAGDVKPEFVL